MAQTASFWMNYVSPTWKHWWNSQLSRSKENIGKKNKAVVNFNFATALVKNDCTLFPRLVPAASVVLQSRWLVGFWKQVPTAGLRWEFYCEFLLWWLERFSCRGKNSAKVATPTNHNRSKQHDDPIRIYGSNYLYMVRLVLVLHVIAWKLVRGF